MPVEDYRVRVGHLVQAMNELKRAVVFLGRRMPDPDDEGIAEKIADFMKEVDEELDAAAWEL